MPLCGVRATAALGSIGYGSQNPYNEHMVAWREFLSSDPQVCGGEICATGTRIPVTVILDNLAEGASKEEIIKSYPSLRISHVDAALAFNGPATH